MMPSEKRLKSVIGRIVPTDAMQGVRAQERLDNLTKPLGSLGRLEQLGVQLARIRRTVHPQVDNAAVMICAADHGVVAQGVTGFPSEVTGLMVANFEHAGAAVNQIAEVCNAQVHVYDVGVGKPTADLSKGPAMSREACVEAVLQGVDALARLYEEGIDIVCLGEMGIGNSTAAAALTAAFTKTAATEVVGRGAGLDDETLRHKIQIVQRALHVNAVETLDALGILAAVGGFEIAMMTGIILGAASLSLPVVSDGFIAGSAVLAAVALAPLTLDYLIFSHRSAEPGHEAIYRYLKVRPLFELDMRLGEGTGATLALPFIRSATRILSNMATFQEAGILL